MCGGFLGGRGEEVIVSTSLTAQPVGHLPCLSSFRVELGEASNTGEQEAFAHHDAAVIREVRSALEIPTQNEGITLETDTASFLSTIAQSDLSELVAVRQAHQTKRAAKSVKTRASPHDTASVQPPKQTDRQKLCAQMTEVIRRAGSGLERDARWKSGTAPGTKGPAEVSTLTGNSANAEVAAKGRVDTVCFPIGRTKDLPPHINSCRPGQHALVTSMGVV